MNRLFSNSSQTPNTQQIGTWGEQLVAQWLRGQGWQILQHQYRTRWGEIDLIAIHPETAHASHEATLIFVEVKTRSRRNWDHDGSLAITSTKQEKLITSAQYFLGESPELANHSCRFDVALVRWDQFSQSIHQQTLVHQTPSPTGEFPNEIILGQPVNRPQGSLILQRYIESAFWMS
jgi:putative endonuclease